jgi:hypothetical protein
MSPQVPWWYYGDAVVLLLAVLLAEILANFQQSVFDVFGFSSKVCVQKITLCVFLLLTAQRYSCMK